MGRVEAWRAQPDATALGLFARILARDDRKPLLEREAALLLADAPRAPTGTADLTLDAAYTTVATLALFQLEEPGSAAWRGWNDALKATLLPSQRARKDGCLDGSWDAEGDRFGLAGGRVYTTSLGVLVLETHYRYPRAIGGRERR